jgi:hypothetical protein
MRHFGILLASAALGAALVPGGPGLALGRGGGGGDGGHFGGFGPGLLAGAWQWATLIVDFSMR